MTEFRTMLIMVLNPGGNSLKAEIVQTEPSQSHAFEGKMLVSLAIEGIGKEPQLLTYDGKKIVATESIDAADYRTAAESLLERFANSTARGLPALSEIDCVGVRVVHGGLELSSPTPITAEVAEKIRELETLAPLHNKNSLEVLEPVSRALHGVPIYGVFDTAFHRTIPDHAALYAIPPEIAAKYRIRRYGFHGISHRYLLERYASLAGKSPAECNLITMHLESGCSVTAIHEGKSVDNTMGLTPLEGLMMGTRSGDIDPSVIPLLVNEGGMCLDEVMHLLNKESGLQGVSGESLDTRVLMKKYGSDARVTLAMDMFVYRVVKAVGAYLAAVGEVEAIIFGGGIAENNVLLRQSIDKALRRFGLEMDPQAIHDVIDIEGRLSTSRSAIQAWVIPVEEGLEIAHECCQAHAARAAS
jgi:acetate kinase